jgi:FtsP/CotA-like multicopper oxidase with cupredoxin domain
MTSILRSRGRLVALAAVVFMCLALISWSQTDRAQAAPVEGLACETSATNSFSLTATSGYILTPDGNSIYMWGYAGPSGAFQLPGPTLCVPQGATVTITLKNLLREPVSISFPGQTGVQADGQPDQPTFSGGALTSLAKAAPTNGTVSYSFTAANAGTFLYRSGTDVAKQVQMGLYGAIVVRPVDGTGAMVMNRAYADPKSKFDPKHEYLHMLSEIDPAFHLAVERKKAVNFATFNSRYFLINGRSMPDTIAPNDVAWLPAQPYGAMVHIQPLSAANPDPALIRYLNTGFGTYPFHPHGNDQRVIGRDGNPLVTSSADTSYEKYLIDIGPGQTVDTTLTWTDMEHWAPSSAANPNPIPVDLPPLQDQLVSPDTWFSESPYLGYTGDLPAGVTANNECGEYYHVAHSHALQQATNYGATFGGMMTLIRIDPPTPNNCPVGTP